MSRSDYYNLVKKQFDERNIAYSDGETVSADPGYVKSGNKAYDSVVGQTLRDRRQQIQNQQTTPVKIRTLSSSVSNLNKRWNAEASNTRWRSVQDRSRFRQNFDQERQSIRDLLDEIEREYGYEDEDFLTDLEQIRAGLDSYDLDSLEKQWAQWDSQEEYDQYLASVLDREEKKKLDLDAYSRELAALEQQLEDYDPQIDWTDTNQRKQYDAGLKELEDEINRRKQYLAQAQRLQKKDEFSAVANPESEKYDAAFDSKSGYVSTEQDGKLQRKDCQVRLVRDGIVVHEGMLASLQRFKDSVKEVMSGYECGLSLEKFNDIKEGDIVEAFTMEEVPQ